MRPRLTPLALAGLVGLACLNAWLMALLFEGRAPEPEPKQKAAVARPRPASNPSAAEVPPPKPRPIGAYSHTLAKPVFFKSRAPYVPPPPPPPPPPKAVTAPPPVPVDPGLVLGGIVIIEGAKKAYIVNRADSRGTWLGEGEMILGWKVEAIDTVTARLQQAGRYMELELYPKKK